MWTCVDPGVIGPSIEALDEIFQMGLPINDPVCLEQISNGFYDHSGRILDGCVIAMDGLAVKTCATFKTGVNKQKDYGIKRAHLSLLY
jgi:hypothetical protein